MNLSKKSQSGFTFIELMVTSAVMLVLASAILLLSQGTVGRNSLKNTAQEVYSDLRQMQNLAISGVRSGGELPFGYGVFFQKNSNSYILFADNSSSHDGIYKASEDALIKEVRLAQNIKISDLRVDSAQRNLLSIVFVPPQPLTCIGGCSQDSTRAFITLEDVSGNQQTIFVNFNGAVGIQ